MLYLLLLAAASYISSRLSRLILIPFDSDFFLVLRFISVMSIFCRYEFFIYITPSRCRPVSAHMVLFWLTIRRCVIYGAYSGLYDPEFVFLYDRRWYWSGYLVVVGMISTEPSIDVIH